MKLINGINKSDNQGIFYNLEGDILFDYKVFGRDLDKPVDVIVTDLRKGKTYGPRRFDNDILDTNEYVRIMIQDVLQEGSNFH